MSILFFVVVVIVEFKVMESSPLRIVLVLEPNGMLYLDRIFSLWLII